MASCAQCGGSVEQSFTCRHCESNFCGDHRLPDDHECPVAVPRQHQVGTHEQKQTVESGVQTPEPMEIDRSPVESGGDSTPDVNLDGSMGAVQDDAWQNSENDRVSSQNRDLWFQTRLAILSGKNKLRTVVALFGVVAVLLGGYNLIAGAAKLPIFAPYRSIYDVMIFSTGRGTNFGVVHLADVALIAIGGVVSWFS